MLFEAELNGVKVKKQIPIRWEEVSYEDFLKLNDAKELTALSVFTGYTPELLKQAKIKNLDKLLSALSFVRSNIQFDRPTKLLDYPITKDLGFEPFGRYTDIKDEVDKGKKGLELLEQYPLICAIYICPLAKNEAAGQMVYDFREAEKIVPEVLKAPCTEVLATGNFLLLKLIGLKNGTEASYRNLPTPMRKLLLALKLWRSLLAFRVRYFFLRRKLRLTDTRFK